MSADNKTLKQKVNDLLAKIEQRFSTDTPATGTTVEMGEAKLKDGTIVTYQGELNVGTQLNVVAPGGEAQPAPNGSHELEDGTIVTVADGIVTDIKVAGETADGEGEGAEVVVNATKVQEMQAEIDALREQVSKYADLASQFASIKETTDKLAETVPNLFEAVQLLSETVEDEQKAPGKQSFTKQVKTEKQSAIDAIMAGAQKFKQKQN